MVTRVQDSLIQMERKTSILGHIVILSVVLILVDLSTIVECTKRLPRKRISMRRSSAEESAIIPNHDLLDGNKREQDGLNTTECALSLVERHSEVCKLVWNVNQLEELLPNLDTMLKRRLGGRKFSFTIHIKKSPSTIGILEDAGQSLLRSMGQFIKFLGYLDKLFAHTVGGELLDRKNLQRNFKSNAESSAFYKEISDITTIDEQEIQRLVQEAWSRKCAFELLKSNKNICDIIERIHTVDELLKSPELNRFKDVQVFSIKLHSEKLNLTDFLDAIVDGLVGKIPFDNNNDIIMGRANQDTQAIMIGNQRTLLNEKGEKVEEVFETADYKVELIKDEVKVEPHVAQNEMSILDRKFVYDSDDDDDDEDDDDDDYNADDNDNDDDDEDEHIDDSEEFLKSRKEQEISVRLPPRFREMKKEEEAKPLIEEPQSELKSFNDYEYGYLYERSKPTDADESSPIDIKHRKLRQYPELLKKAKQHLRYGRY